MKKIFLSSVAAAAFVSTGAFAADVPARRVAPIAPVVPLFTWTGFYVGANAGYAFSDSENDSGNVVFLPAGSVINSGGTAGTLTFNNGFFGSNNDADGFAGGGQIGFNYQFTPGSGFVVGIEADLQYADISSNGSNGGGFGGGAGSYTFVGTPGLAFAPPAATVFRGDNSTSLEYFGTVRARIGYAFDRVLVYGTGGFAYGGGEGNNSSFFSSNNDDTRYGYTFGGGVEFALPVGTFSLFGSSAVTFGIEALYVNLEEDNNSNGFNTAFFNPATNQLFLNNTSNNSETEFGVVRAKINFKF